MVVLKNCGPQLLYILAELFNIVSQGLVFQIFGRSHWWSLYLRILVVSLLLKTTALLVFFLWLVVFKKLVNDMIVDHLEKCSLFSEFQYGFRCSQSPAHLLTVVSDKIARAFNSLGATWAIALDISKAFDRVWHAGLLHKLKACIYYFLSNFYFSPNKCPWKNMKNVSYFI